MKITRGEPNRYFHNRPDFGTFTSASQVQLDVYYDSLIDTINTFGKLEPYKALLFANSYMSEYPDLMCARNMLWEHSMQGYNPHNVGMFGSELKNIDELLEYIKSTSIYCTMRNGKYVNFTPVPISNFLKREKVEGEYFDGKQYQKIDIINDMKQYFVRNYNYDEISEILDFQLNKLAGNNRYSDKVYELYKNDFQTTMTSKVTKER